MCQAQAFPVPIFRQVLILTNVGELEIDLFLAEPIGSKAPTFSTDFTSSALTRHSGQALVLLCQAQAFPVPIFRQVIVLKSHLDQTRDVEN